MSLTLCQRDSVTLIPVISLYIGDTGFFLCNHTGLCTTQLRMSNRFSALKICCRTASVLNIILTERFLPHRLIQPMSFLSFYLQHAYGRFSVAMRALIYSCFWLKMQMNDNAVNLKCYFYESRCQSDKAVSLLKDFWKHVQLLVIHRIIQNRHDHLLFMVNICSNCLEGCVLVRSQNGGE